MAILLIVTIIYALVVVNVIPLILNSMNDDILIDYVICKQRSIYLQELLKDYNKNTTIGDALVDTLENLKVLKRKLKEEYGS